MFDKSARLLTPTAMQKTVPISRNGFLITDESVLALACSFSLLLTLYAGLLIMLTLASLCQNTCASTLTFEPLQSAFQGFVFADAYLGHCYPSPRSTRLSPKGAYGEHVCIITLNFVLVNKKFRFPCKFPVTPSAQPAFRRPEHGNACASPSGRRPRRSC